MPFACNSPNGSDSGSVASANLNLIDGICADIRSNLLFVFFQAVRFQKQPFLYVGCTHSTLYMFVHFTALLSLSLIFPRLCRYSLCKGRCRSGKGKPKKKFLRVFSGMTRLKNFVKVLNEQVFALMQKTDCLNRKAVSLTFSASFLAKFCEFQNLRSDDLRHIQRISY